MTDEELAAHLAEEAGRLLLEQRQSALLEGAALGAVADQVANAFILAGLALWRPGDAILSEESFDDRRAAGRISGSGSSTRSTAPANMAKGADDWAVHVALAIDGVPRVGAVAVPAMGRLFRSDRAAAPPDAGRARPIMLVSRTRPPAEAEEIADSARRRAGGDGLGRGQGDGGRARARRTSITMPAASTNGTIARPPRSRSPPGSTPAGSTAPRSPTTGRTQHARPRHRPARARRGASSPSARADFLIRFGRSAQEGGFVSSPT